MSCLNIFSYILQVFVLNVWCCTVSNFYVMPVIHPIFIALVCIVELISTGDGQIMETLDSVGIKLFLLAAL